jgi:hypothetical protein
MRTPVACVLTLGLTAASAAAQAPQEFPMAPVLRPQLLEFPDHSRQEPLAPGDRARMSAAIVVYACPMCGLELT